MAFENPGNPAANLYPSLLPSGNLSLDRGFTPRSSLSLLPCLIDVHRDLQSLAASSETRPAHRGGTQIVKADCNPDMRIGRTNSIRRIKANPSEIFYIGLRPGMPGILGRDAVGTTKVSSD